ncbi:MAG: glycosyltransferase family 39 protein, partial [Kiritimatiellae bacterium]|nr:glycosyltransferase family 39 protein [Kiritimatiellia bacterium]
MKKGLFVFVFLTAIAASRQLAFDDDEFQHLHMAWLLARGNVPHLDFFEHHLPLYHFVLAPLTLGNAGPARIMTARFLSVLFLTGTLYLTYEFLRRRVSSHSALIVCFWLALSPIFFVKMVEVRPEGFCLFLASAALLLLSRPRPALFISGLLAGAMVMGSQKFLFLAFGIFLLAGLENGFKGLLRFSLGGLIPPLLILGYYLSHQTLPLAWEHLVVLNHAWRESFSPAMYGSLLWNTSPLLVALAVTGLCCARPSSRPAAALLLGSGLTAVFIVPIPYRQTFLMLYPGLCLSAAASLDLLLPLFPAGSPRRGGVLVLVLAGLLPSLHGLRQDLRETLHEDMALMQYVDQYTTGPFFDGRGLVFWRPHIGYYPWMHEGLMFMLDPELHAAQSEEAIRSAGFPDLLRDYRVESYMSPSLHAFIDSHYV